MTDFGCVSSRILWVEVGVMVYGLTQGEVKERERSWNDLDRVMDRLWVMGLGYES